MSKYRKFLVAALGAIATLVSSNVLPPDSSVSRILVAISAVATALGVVAVPNKASQVSSKTL